MFKRLIEWFQIHKRFAELQKSNDGRLMLNRRLSQQNADLKSELQRCKKPKDEKAVSSAAQKHINNMADQHSLQKARHHIALMRREVIVKKMALHLPFDTVNRIQEEVEAMSDTQVLAWKKPKSQIATSISN